MERIKPYNLIILKECHATISASSMDEAIEIGYNLCDEENYDDVTIKSVRCLGESETEYDDDWDDENIDLDYVDLDSLDFYGDIDDDKDWN